MIFLLAPTILTACEFLDRKKLDPESVSIIVAPYSVDDGVYDPHTDTIIRLPDTPDELFFELTVR